MRKLNADAWGLPNFSQAAEQPGGNIWASPGKKRSASILNVAHEDGDDDDGDDVDGGGDDGCDGL